MPLMMKTMTMKLIVSFGIFVYNGTPVINNHLNNDDQGAQARSIQFLANYNNLNV